MEGDPKRVLVLNASYEPLSVVSDSRAITLLLLGRASLLEGTGRTFSSQNEILEVPSVILLNEMVDAKRERQVPLSRRALFARDNHTCQYCGVEAGTVVWDKHLNEYVKVKLEVEHVFPRSRGGKNVWENVVAACRECNGRKADRTPEEAGMMLRRKPFAPTHRKMIATRGGENWGKYLG